MSFESTKQKLKNIKKQVIEKYSNRKVSIEYYNTNVFAPAHSFMLHKLKLGNSYEEYNINIICSIIKKSNTYFFDIGANIGLISIPVLHNCPNCNVISFEPSPNSLKYLQETLSKSGYKDRWSVIGQAISSEISTREFALASEIMGAYDGFIDTKRRPIEKTITISTTTIDEQWERLEKPKIGVIKIDVEGAELEVLEGGLECIKQEQPHLLLEWNSKNLEAYNLSQDMLLEWAERQLYRIYSVPHLVPILNGLDLKVQMLQTENFLLVPENKKID